jgi:hypothetical protein
MHTSPPTLPAIIAGLRTALEADARGVSNLLLALLLRLLASLEPLARTWHATTTTRQAPAEYDRDGRLRFHLRLRDARRARILSRGSRGRRRIPTWRARNRGARSLPSRAQPQARPTIARAPPRPVLA